MITETEAVFDTLPETATDVTAQDFLDAASEVLGSNAEVPGTDAAKFVAGTHKVLDPRALDPKFVTPDQLWHWAQQMTSQLDDDYFDWLMAVWSAVAPELALATA
jgi:hypothetical protein